MRDNASGQISLELLEELGVSLDEDVKDLFQEMVEWRRYLHRYPELSLKEYNTSKFIAEILRDQVDEVVKGIAETGLLGVLKSPQPKARIAFRADMDALPIQEQTGLEYSSQNEGVMHACGHDLHMATLLGLVKLARKLRDSGKLPFELGFIFQPGEEGGYGAKRMLDEGLFEIFNPHAIIGFHVWTQHQLGTIGIDPGPIMAAFDQVEVTLKGPGGHSSAPHKSVDLILVASHLILALYSLASREADPMNPSVLTFGFIRGGTATNVIPSELKFGGTLRTYSDKDREHLKRRIHEVAKGIASSFNAEVEVEISEGYPVTANSEHLVEIFRDIATKRGLKLVPSRGLGSEDFSYFSQLKPSVYLIVGASSGKVTEHHSPYFLPDERAMAVALQLFKDFLLSWNGEL